MTLYIVTDGEGHKLTDGLQEHEARRTAQSIADRLGASVYLSDRDDPEDDGEEVRPDPTVPMTLDAIIGDCSVSPEAAQALADAMPRLTPSGGHGDAYATSSGLARKIADLLKSGDVIGYATRDALDESTWDKVADLVGFTDQGSGMEVD